MASSDYYANKTPPHQQRRVPVVLGWAFFFLFGKIFRGSAVLKIFWHMARASLALMKDRRSGILMRWFCFVLFFPSSCSWCCCCRLLSHSVEIFRGCFLSRLASMIPKEVVSIWDSTLFGIFHMCSSLFIIQLSWPAIIKSQTKSLE